MQPRKKQKLTYGQERIFKGKTIPPRKKQKHQALSTEF